MALPRMRTVREAVAMIKAEDPGTAISEHAIRGLIKSGKLPIVQSGRRFLINYDGLLSYLTLSEEQSNPPKSFCEHQGNAPTERAIRRIEV